MSTTYPHHLYSHLHHPHQKLSKNKVPSVASWTITLGQSTPPPNHHHHLQWYSIDLSLYLMCLHSQLKLHLQCSTLAIIIAPQMRHILSQPSQSQLVTRPRGARKHSKNRVKICQIFLSLPHSTLNNLLSLLTKHGTDCPFHSLSWMPLLQFKSSISFLPTPLWDSL
jgi:hypothetical protein